MNKNFERFQPLGESWGKRALKDGLRTVLDSTDLKGIKNEYIDTLHKIILAKYLLLDKNEKILDFGCGTGRFTSWLKERGFKVVGIDITEEMLDVAKKTYPNDIFILYDGIDLPFDDQSFDRVLSVFVLQHISDQNDFWRTVTELVRCVKKGGMIYLIEQISEKYSDYYIHKLPKDYIETFNRCNCKCILNRPIRDGRSLIPEVLKRCFIPRFLFPIIARFDLCLIKNKSVPDKGYLDYFFMFQKEK